MADRLGQDLTGGHTRPDQNHRHPGRLFIHRGLAPQATRAQVVAVVTGVDHQRVTGHAGLIERGQHLAHLLVHERDQAAVTGDRPPDILRTVKVRVVVHHPGVFVCEGMVRSNGLVVELGHGQVHGSVILIPARRCGQREMRCHHGHKQDPGLVSSLLTPGLEPVAGCLADIAVIGGVSGFARAGQLGHLVAALAHRNVVAHQALDIAQAVNHMHGQNLFGPAVVVTCTAPEMQLADRHRVMAGLPQHMVPTGNAAVVGVSVVPETDLVNITPRGKGRPRRHTNRAAGVCVGEAGAARGQPVQVRGLNERMTGTPQKLGVVLVGHQHQNIEWLGHLAAGRA